MAKLFRRNPVRFQALPTIVIGKGHLSPDQMDIERTAEKLERVFSRQVRVLIVEDNKHDREHIKALWTEMGVFVADVGDGSSALDLASKLVFDMAIVDLNLPGMPGIDCLLQLQTKIEHRAAITGGPGPWVDDARKRCPVLTLFEKPFKFENCEELMRLFGLRISRKTNGQRQ